MSEIEAPLSFPLGGGGVMQPAYARMLMSLLPPGRVWRWFSGSTLYTVLEACADELARLHDRVIDMLTEAIPATAVELLPEYERELDIEAAATTEERQALVVAHTIADQGYRPADFQTTLAAVLGLDAEDVVVVERTNADATAMGDVREIFRFFIFRDPTLPGTYSVDSAQVLVDKIKPTHTAGHVIESVEFLCDDPYSLTDRDILGA